MAKLKFGAVLFLTLASVLCEVKAEGERKQDVDLSQYRTETGDDKAGTANVVKTSSARGVVNVTASETSPPRQESALTRTMVQSKQSESKAAEFRRTGPTGPTGQRNQSTEKDSATRLAYSSNPTDDTAGRRPSEDTVIRPPSADRPDSSKGVPGVKILANNSNPVPPIKSNSSSPLHLYDTGTATAPVQASVGTKSNTPGAKLDSYGVNSSPPEKISTSIPAPSTEIQRALLRGPDPSHISGGLQPPVGQSLPGNQLNGQSPSTGPPGSQSPPGSRLSSQPGIQGPPGGQPGGQSQLGQNGIQSPPDVQPGSQSPLGQPGFQPPPDVQPGSQSPPVGQPGGQSPSGVQSLPGVQVNGESLPGGQGQLGVVPPEKKTTTVKVTAMLTSTAKPTSGDKLRTPVDFNPADPEDELEEDQYKDDERGEEEDGFGREMEEIGDDDDDDDDDDEPNKDKKPIYPQNQQKTGMIKNQASNPQLIKDPEIESSGHFMAYFVLFAVVVVIAYLVYHNRKKVLGYLIEGRNGRKGPRRPSSSEYKKLASNMEEALPSFADKSSTQNIIY